MPKDWKIGKLGDIAEITSGKRPLAKQNNINDEFCIPLIGASCVMGYTNSVLYSNRILITGRVGTHGVVQRFNEPCWPSDNTLVILSRCYEYCYQILKTINYTAMNRGSTQPLITQTDLKNTEIVVPTNKILTDYEKDIGALMNLYESNQRENTRLAAIRDALLPKLMSGEIDVSNVDISALTSTDKLSFRCRSPPKKISYRFSRYFPLGSVFCGNLSHSSLLKISWLSVSILRMYSSKIAEVWCSSVPSSAAIKAP